MNRKIAETMIHSPDVNLRLAIEFMQDAMKSAKQGNIVDFCTCIRLAAKFEQKIDPELRLNA